MLLSLRNNENSELLHVEYFKYELAILAKIKERRLVLEGKDEANDLEFIKENDDKDEKMEDEKQSGMFEISENYLKIAFETIQNKFANNLRCFEVIWHDVVKHNKFVSSEFKELVKKCYQDKRYGSPSLFNQFVEIKLEKSSGKLLETVKKLIEHKETFLSKHPGKDPSEKMMSAKNLIIDHFNQKLDEKDESVSQNACDIVASILTNFCETKDEKIELILK